MTVVPVLRDRGADAILGDLSTGRPVALPSSSLRLPVKLPGLPATLSSPEPNDALSGCLMRTYRCLPAGGESKDSLHLALSSVALYLLLQAQWRRHAAQKVHQRLRTADKLIQAALRGCRGLW